jgi:hypothetical protein
MRAGVAFDYQPRMAAGAVVPMFAVNARWIVAKVDEIAEFRGGSWRRRVRPDKVRVAAIAEFVSVTLAAIGAMNSHG